MNILILGGTGAMGTPVVNILADHAHNITVTTRESRVSRCKNVSFVKGNAHDLVFIRRLLNNSYDVIIDFMIYQPNEFAMFSELYLGKTKQYFFISSARVYANSSGNRITEESPRLLDVVRDKEYLNTDEYALAKAREENILFNGKYRNYTIIRPYITYFDNRMQLGIYEKEIWLQRALRGKKIVFSHNIASKYTTLTYGYDVALRIADLVGKNVALGQVYHITTEECIRWKDILECYLDVLEKHLGYRPDVCWTQNSDPLLEKTNYYQIHCDREYDRCFSNKKIQVDTSEQKPFMSVTDGLEICLSNFLKGNKNFHFCDWREEAVLDRISGDRSKFKEIPGIKNKVKYYLYRYFIRL